MASTNQSSVPAPHAHIMKTPERPNRSRQRVAEALPQPSPFSSYMSALPILSTPNRGALPNLLECSPGTFAGLTSPGFGGYPRDGEARSPSASHILLTSPFPRKAKQADDPELPFTHDRHKSPLPIFKSGKRSPHPAKQGAILPRFGTETLMPSNELGGSGLLDDVDLEHYCYGWTAKIGGVKKEEVGRAGVTADDRSPFEDNKQPIERTLKRKLFSPSNTARALDDLFPTAHDALGTENHAPGTTPQRAARSQLTRELSLAVYVAPSPPMSPTGSALLTHHAGNNAVASPGMAGVALPLLIHSPDPPSRDPHHVLGPSTNPNDTNQLGMPQYAPMLMTSSRLSAGGGSGAPPSLCTAPSLNSPMMPPPLLNLQPPTTIDNGGGAPPGSGLHGTTNELLHGAWSNPHGHSPINGPSRRGASPPSSSDDIPFEDDSSDEDYIESPVRGRGRNARSTKRNTSKRSHGGCSRRGGSGGDPMRGGGKEALVNTMQQVKAAPARRGGSKHRDMHQLHSGGVPFPPTPLEPGAGDMGSGMPLLLGDGGMDHHLGGMGARGSSRSSRGGGNSNIKRCNCKRSKCLKLYCDCFAAGLYCGLTCSCQQCYNTEANKAIVDEKRDAIRQRNPTAFTQKIEDNGQHARGCNCKKSRCKKGYCECFQAGVPCGEACRCCGCENPHGYVIGIPGADDDDDDDDGMARARAALPLPVTPSTITSYKAPASKSRRNTALHFYTTHP